ncbi:hypothetical protein TSTA_057250 [Talaromyces stipitatus ATCC 10500]|uniref:Uncharacterized protein n=1 Tax=Talaromyces stipitatus (strain ATCC 10500 / CBS 375.48 / QM 6759 / NRRL 1006) TaxID=441959 RepID=B8MRS3_TALSN|nr:uncharacterized protein TSTA_057250 [Talaromyces stipitatus ATCC 10500]EED13230.1 hypothetical protein TSTA_057250 [Talaromyces stipitatus ATCC 10500]
MLLPLREDITLVEGFVRTVLKTLRDHGDPEETEHLTAEANCDNFFAAFKWVQYLHNRASLLSEEARGQQWKQFLANVEGVLRQVARWAFEKYPEGVLSTLMTRYQSGDSNFEMDIDSPDDQTDWTWALQAALELEVATEMMQVDFTATALSEMSF